MKKRDINPIWMAVAPVMTPDDRSNSPPIINSATAAAMMPERGGDVEPVEGGVGLSERSTVPPEERPDDDRTDEGPDLRRHQPVAHRTAMRDAFVQWRSAAASIPVRR